MGSIIDPGIMFFLQILLLIMLRCSLCYITEYSKVGFWEIFLKGQLYSNFPWAPFWPQKHRHMHSLKYLLFQVVEFILLKWIQKERKKAISRNNLKTLLDHVIWKLTIFNLSVIQCDKSLESSNLNTYVGYKRSTVYYENKVIRIS